MIQSMQGFMAPVINSMTSEKLSQTNWIGHTPPSCLYGVCMPLKLPVKNGPEMGSGNAVCYRIKR